MIYFILNPASQSGQGLNLFQTLIPILEKNEVEYETLTSSYSGHISKLAADLVIAHKSDNTPIHVVVLGGDGTLNEVLQEIPDFSKICLGYIPTGSGNDFARSIGIPHSPEKALEKIIHNIRTNQLRPLDLGVINYVNMQNACTQRKVFIGSSGIGFDAAVCASVQNSRLKKILNHLHMGQLVYICIALKHIITAKMVSAEILLDDVQRINTNHTLFISTMLHKYEGGGLMLCPNADCSDGLFDLCVIDNVPRLFVPFLLPLAYFGKHYIYPSIKTYQAHTVEISTSQPLWLHTDGETPMPTNHLVIHCEKQAIRFLL